jgi:membrane-bound lytic murein transglycosylase D
MKVEIFKMNHKFLFPIILLCFIANFSLYAQTNDSLATQKIKFPDEFTILDDDYNKDVFHSKEFQEAVKFSRMKYHDALVYLKKRDSVRAAKSFESAIARVNQYVSYPGIENEKEFLDLVHSIIEDYENYITTIDDLDENSSIFIVRKMLFNQIETLTPEQSAKNINTSDAISGDAKPVVLGTTGFFPPPDSVIIPIVMNEQIEKAVDKLINNKTLRKYYKVYLERSSKFFPMMAKIAQYENAPKELIYLTMYESGVNPNAISSASAVGLWQFIYTTGQMYGLNKNESIWIDERRDPEKSTRAALRHLKDLYVALGDWNLAFAAYNCGLGCVRNAIRKSKLENPDFWAIQEFLPRETRNYVPNFLAVAIVAMNPLKYGFTEEEMKFHKEYKYDVYVLNEPLNLESLSKAADITVSQLKELNPELIRNCTPVDATTYYLKIPESSSASFATNLENIPYDEKKPYVVHKLEKGETIRSIAERFNVSKDEVSKLNQYSGVLDNLNVESQLLLPLTQKTYDSLKVATKPMDITSSDLDSENTRKVIKSDQKAKEITHTVAEGENLYIISQKYGVNLAELKRINNIEESGIIKVGQKLTISDPDVQFVEQTSIIIHKVRKGETFASIAEEYNMNVADLKKINNIKQKVKSIKKGKVLKVLVTEVCAVNNNGETISSSESNVSTTEITKTKTKDEISDKPIIHKVRNGESLEKIAVKYNCTIDQIKEWNPDLVDGEKIFKDTKLKIYKSEPASSASTAKSKIKKYKIKSGDTLSSIADKFNVSVKQLRDWNNIKEKDINRIVVGRTLVIK